MGHVGLWDRADGCVWGGAADGRAEGEGDHVTLRMWESTGPRLPPAPTRRWRDVPLGVPPHLLKLVGMVTIHSQSSSPVLAILCNAPAGCAATLPGPST